MAKLNEALDNEDSNGSGSDDLEVTKITSITTLKEAVYNQINRVPNKHENDLLGEFMSSFNILRSFYGMHNNSMLLLNATKAEVMDRILQKFLDEGLKVDRNSIDALTMAVTTYDFTIALYEFMVLYRFEGVKNFLVNIVVDNQREYVKQFKADVNKKDLRTASLRKIFKNFDDVVVLDRLQLIVDQIVLCEDDGVNSNALAFITRNNEDFLHNSVILNEFDGIACPNFLKFFVLPMQQNSMFKSRMYMAVYEALTSQFEKKTATDDSTQDD